MIIVQANSVMIFEQGDNFWVTRYEKNLSSEGHSDDLKWVKTLLGDVAHCSERTVINCRLITLVSVELDD